MDERIYIIIAKQLSGEVSKEELTELDGWLASGADNKAAYEEAQRLWNETDDILSEPTFDTTAAWASVASNINFKTEPIQTGRNRTIAFPSWTKYVVSAAAILLAAVLVWKPLSEKNMITVVADNNMEVVLPDSSRVTLHTGSTLTYSKAFDGAERHVALAGQAFFKVTRDETKPFVIDAASATVQVLGTSFNVNCNDSEAVVVVATGKVQMVSAKNATQKLILTPGKQGTLQNNNLKEESVNDDNYLYWMTGVLNFDNRPLKNIMQEIGRLNKTTITFSPTVPDVIQNQMITISFDHQPLEEMLTELCLVSKCQWKKDNTIYIISTNDK